MSTTKPIKDKKDLRQFKEFYQTQCPNLRNYTLIVTALNTALRISDILSLTYDMVYDKDRVRTHIELKEQKTGKNNLVKINKEAAAVLMLYRKAFIKSKSYLSGNPFLFPSPKNKGKHLSRFQAYRIIRAASEAIHAKNRISCHSLRKTFGYYAWKKCSNPVLLMAIYNHSSFTITRRYLCIDQDDKDFIYEKTVI